MESFFSTLKLELDFDDDRQVLVLPQQQLLEMALWIEGYYNLESRYSTIAFQSSIDFEHRTTAARTLTPSDP